MVLYARDPRRVYRRVGTYWIACGHSKLDAGELEAVAGQVPHKGKLGKEREAVERERAAAARATV